MASLEGRTMVSPLKGSQWTGTDPLLPRALPHELPGSELQKRAKVKHGQALSCLKTPTKDMKVQALGYPGEGRAGHGIRRASASCLCLLVSPAMLVSLMMAAKMPSSSTA